MPSHEVATVLYSLIHRLLRILRSKGRTTDMSGERLSTLLTLNNNGHASIKELALSEQVAHSTMSRMVSGLTASGLAQAHSHGVDRRTSSIKLTSKGKRVAHKTLEQFTDPLATAVSSLSRDEQDVLVDAIGVLEKLLEKLSRTV